MQNIVKRYEVVRSIQSKFVSSLYGTYSVVGNVRIRVQVMNIWPDEDPLWQCPGYFVESGMH